MRRKSQLVVAGVIMLSAASLLLAGCTGPQTSHDAVRAPDGKRADVAPPESSATATPNGGSSGAASAVDPLRTTEQLTAELTAPSDFMSDDWTSLSTKAGTPEDNDTDACAMGFGTVDRQYGMQRQVTRNLFEESTRHEVWETVAYFGTASTVIVAEDNALSFCGAVDHFDNGQGTDVALTTGPLSSTAIGLNAERTFCRSIKAVSKDPQFAYSGFACTMVSGDHEVQVYEISSDPSHPVTLAGFSSIAGKSLEKAVAR